MVDAAGAFHILGNEINAAIFDTYIFVLIENFAFTFILVISQNGNGNVHRSFQ